MSRDRQNDWTEFQKLALAECLARGATLAETMAATGRTERQVKDRIHNGKKKMPESWRQPRAKGFAFQNVQARGTDRSKLAMELNLNPSNPRLALRKFSWQLAEEGA